MSITDLPKEVTWPATPRTDGAVCRWCGQQTHTPVQLRACLLRMQAHNLRD